MTHIGTILDVLERDVQIGLLNDLFDRESVKAIFDSMRNHLEVEKDIENDLYREYK